MLKMFPKPQWLSFPQHEALDRDGPVDVPFEVFTSELIFRPISDRFDQIAARYSDKIAVDDGDIRLTYAEVQRASVALARNIEACAPSGQPIGVMLRHAAYFPIAALACLRGGRPVVPIDPGLPAGRIALIGEEARITLVIVDGPEGDSNDPFADIPRLDVTGSLGASGQEASNAAPSDGAAVILYTSGSTGRPKGICNNQSAILSRVAHFTNSCHLNAGDRFLLLSSTGTIAGVRDIFTALLNGATLVIAEPARVGYGGILRILASERITVCYALPALLRGMFKLHDARSAFQHLRILRLGGDIIWERDIVLCRSMLPSTCHIQIGYGSTEVPTTLQWFVPPDWSGDGTRMPCGRFTPDVLVALVDDEGNPPRAGETGELLVRSEHIALGLWQDGKLQVDICEGDPSQPFFRTGDLVRLREDGLAEVLGRKGRWLKIRGQRVDPAEVEGIARSSKEVADAAVLVRTEAGEATGLEVFVVPRDPEKPPRIDELHAMMAERLPGYARPNRIHVVAAIPLLAGFKPDLVALAELAKETPEAKSESDPAKGMTVQPGGDDRVGKAVVHAWSKVLDRKSVEADDPWDIAGGDSLKALSLVLLIEEALRVQVPLDLLHQSTRPSELTYALGRLLSEPAVDGVEEARTSGRPLAFMMPGVGGDETSLAELRAELGDRIRFVLADYPPSIALIEAGLNFDGIVDAVVAQIRGATKSDDVVNLVGYSFGGFVTWEVAKRLHAAGSRVGGIVLIDPLRTSNVDKLESRQNLSRRAERILRSILIQPRHSFDRILWETVYSFVKRAPPALLRPMPALAMKFPVAIATRLLLILNGTLRARALNSFTQSKFDYPARLFRSEDFIEESSDAGWSEVCPQLEIVMIGGTHVSMMENPRRAILAEQLFATMAGAESSTR
jgi:acyl-coenzyme A synthetase/AMP-(fatty) acid ligase/thioesterase domain-containing protein/acyl carrier protein